MENRSYPSTLTDETDLLLRLIAEDIKLNYLHFGLKDLGIEFELDILAIGEIVFDRLGSDESVREEYYQRINTLRGLTSDEIQERLEENSQAIYEEVLLQKLVAV